VPLISNLLVRQIGIRGVSFCPGEWDCERFQSSAAPQENACITCEKKPTKPITISSVTSADEKEAHALVEHLSDVRDLQRAGLMNPATLNALEVELLKYWHRTEADLLLAHTAAQRMF